jgi:hypothetical protein
MCDDTQLQIVEQLLRRFIEIDDIIQDVSKTTGDSLVISNNCLKYAGLGIATWMYCDDDESLRQIYKYYKGAIFGAYKHGIFFYSEKIMLFRDKYKKDLSDRISEYSTKMKTLDEATSNLNIKFYSEIQEDKFVELLYKVKDIYKEFIACHPDLEKSLYDKKDKEKRDWHKHLIGTAIAIFALIASIVAVVISA